MTSTSKRLLITLTLLAAPLPALAQTDTTKDTKTTAPATDTTKTTAPATDTSTGAASTDTAGSTTGNTTSGTATTTENRSSFPWGLLGLIGLAGLAGANRRERTEVKLGGPTDGPKRA